MVPEQLPGGKYFAYTEEIRTQTRSVPTHNKLPEFVFGILDHLVRVRPNATILTNGAFLMFAYNKTGEWLESLSATTREEVIDQARRSTREFKRKFKERQVAIENQRKEALAEKKRAIEKKLGKDLKEKGDYTSQIIYYGLWQTSDEVKNKLSQYNATEQIKALQAQLRFRQKV